MTKPISSEAKAAWAAVFATLFIAALGAMFTYGKVAAQVEDIPQMKKDIGEIKVTVGRIEGVIQQRGFMAHNTTNHLELGEN